MTSATKERSTLIRGAVLSLSWLLALTVVGQAGQGGLKKLVRLAERVAADHHVGIDTTREDEGLVVFRIREQDDLAFLVGKFVERPRGVAYELAFVDEEDVEISSEAPLFTMRMSDEAKSVRKSLWREAQRDGIELSKSDSADVALLLLALDLQESLASGRLDQGCRPETERPDHGTVADARLQRDIMKMITMYESATGGSATPTLVCTEVLSRMENTTVERWIIDSSGAQVVYEVAITPSPQGGTRFSVKRLLE